MLITYNYKIFDNELKKMVLNTFKLSEVYNFYNLDNIEDIFSQYNQRYTLEVKACNVSDIIWKNNAWQ